MRRAFVAVLALTATPALADLTAEEVLAEHLNLLSGYGLIEVQTTGTTERANGLSVAGFVATYEDEDTQVDITTPGMELTENTDGSVSITYPDVIEVTVTATPAEEDLRSVTLALNTTGLTHEVSGDPNNLTHAIAFETLSLGDVTTDPPQALDDMDLSMDFAIAGFDSTLTFDTRDITRRNVEVSFVGLTLAGQALTPANINLDTPGTTYDSTGLGESNFNIALSNFATRVGYIGETIPRHSLSTRIGQLVWQQDTDMGDAEGSFDISMNTSDFGLSYDVALDTEAIDDDPLAAILDGQSASGALNFADFAYGFTIDTPEGTVVATSSSGTSETRFSFDENGFALFSDTVDQTANFGGPLLELPFSNFSYSIARSMIDFVFPISPSEAVQPFRLNFALQGVSIDDTLWALFDPEARLPRGPADLVIDMDGETIVNENPWADDAEMPFADFKANLNALRLSLLGAEITGDGSVTDKSNGAEPAADGVLNLRMTGLNTLIDTAVDMGLLPNEQAMGARMGLSLIGRPDGPDTLTSKIEINEAGEIYANGQRIK